MAKKVFLYTKKLFAGNESGTEEKNYEVFSSELGTVVTVRSRDSDKLRLEAFEMWIGYRKKNGKDQLDG